MIDAGDPVPGGMPAFDFEGDVRPVDGDQQGEEELPEPVTIKANWAFVFNMPTYAIGLRMAIVFVGSTRDGCRLARRA